jgi:heme-degrading monooxygenase HmoA
MLCALTVRTLEPGTFDQFREAFMRGMNPDDPPPGWVRFNMVRNTDNPDEVVCFGIFDGTVDDLRQAQTDPRREDQLKEIAGYVQSTGADVLYEVVEDLSIAERPPR